MIYVIVAVSVLLPIIIVVMVLAKFRKAGAFGPTKAQRAQAEELVKTGAKARGTILAVQPTGMVVNNINIGVVITFSIQPLEGGTPWQANKDAVINQTQMPRMGDVWPVWYDRADPSKFAVGQPGVPTAEQLAIFREFGIPHPLDPSAQAQIQAQQAQQYNQMAQQFLQQMPQQPGQQPGQLPGQQPGQPPQG